MRGLNRGLLAALMLAVAASLLAGRVWINPLAPLYPNAGIILTELRLPRAVLAVVIGAGLGAGGGAMQGYLRNPLADPGLFGVAPTAALGAVVWLLVLAQGWVSASGALGYLALPLAALLGAALAMAALALMAGRGGGTLTFTLAGMMISSLAGALTSLVISLAPSPFALSQIVSWMMGALTDRSWQDVEVAAPLVAVGLVLLALAGRGLDALSLGEVTARSLGVNPAAMRALMIGGIGLTVGAGVAVAGVIGFVGLVVPHLVRPLTDRRPSALLLPSALAGALLLVVADSACRLLPVAGGEVRLGIALSLLGAPFFLALVWRMARSGQAGGWA